MKTIIEEMTRVAKWPMGVMISCRERQAALAWQHLDETAIA
ncbi:uncharacterized protein conserved in bacteria [Serratia symbiotica]|uniref:Uncharacterized protein conserved in bacteria n=1 Tax=Serratia symbiotica TaxID=138074 RepID=A0A455VLH7_9GAMM|nr:uncharacterized protein conserved in bacteria [Serratia symbiotica]